VPSNATVVKFVLANVALVMEELLEDYGVAMCCIGCQLVYLDIWLASLARVVASYVDQCCVWCGNCRLLLSVQGVILALGVDIQRNGIWLWACADIGDRVCFWLGKSCAGLI